MIGDVIDIVLLDEPAQFEIVGIYQDITNGGLTAKISEGHLGDISQYSFFVNLKREVELDSFVDEWSQAYPQAKVIRVDQLINQTLGSITSSLNVAVIAIIILSLIIMGLVALLFLLLRLHKDYADHAILLAIGYKAKTLRTMYLVKSLFSSLIGAVLGLFVSLVIGESLMSFVLTMMAFGITKLQFIINPIYLILAGVIAPSLVVYMITINVTRSINKTSVMTLGHE
jgi:putative ABC transport system permease protein